MPAALLATCWVLLEIGTRCAARITGRKLAGSTALLCGAITGLAILLLLSIALGLAGWLGTLPLAGSLLLALLAAVALEPRWTLRAAVRRGLALAFPRARARWPAALLLWTTVVAMLLACGSDIATNLTFDSLYYHLPFTADAVRTGGIPLGDDAQAHQPKNHGLVSAALWLLSGSEAVAAAGNLLWWPLGTLALYVAARALGCGRGPALAGTLVPFFVPEWVAQAKGAMADLPFAVAWLAFASCALVGARRRDAGLALPAGLAFGIAVGCKSLALPFAPLAAAFVVALLVRVARGTRARALLGFTIGALATGSFFYARNLALTGNPLYPIELRALGHVVFPGDYGNEIMVDWIFAQRARTDQPEWLSLAHLFVPLTSTVRQSVASWLGNLDAILAAHLIVPALTVLFGLVARFRQPMVWLCALVPPAVVATCWFVLPYTYSRFALLAVLFVAVLASCLASVGRGLWLAILAALAFALLEGNGMPRTLAIAAATALGVTFLARFAPRPRLAAGLLLATVLGPLAIGAYQLLAPKTRVDASGAPPMEPYRAALAHCEGNVAVAGTELRYGFAYGRSHRAARVPLDGRSEVPYHERALAWRREALPRPTTPEARLQDRHADPAAWLATLRAGFDTLVVARLQHQALLAHRHDANGFPEELAWAEAASPTLREVYRDAEVRVFRIQRALDPAGPLPPPRERREPEALSLLNDPEALARWYPLATLELRDPRYERALARVRSGGARR